MSKTIKTKIKPKYIIVERGEGPTHLCGKPHIFKTFADADSLLRKWARDIKHDCYDKCDFIVVWRDGDTYTGRFDLKAIHSGEPNLIADHISGHLEWYAGICKTPWCGEEKYREYLASEPPSFARKCKKMLKTYDLSL